MAYADKCFYFDWGDRHIKLKDFDIYDEITVRRRDLWEEEEGEDSHNVSIELWVKDSERKKHEDREIVLSRDNAMALATKLIRAVAELDADDYLYDLREDVYILKRLAGDKFDEAVERRSKFGLCRDPKGGLMGAIANYVDTPKGVDTLKELSKLEKKNGQ